MKNLLKQGIDMKRLHYTAPYILNPTHQLTVALVGIGGTGSQVLSALARIDCALQSLGHPGLHVTAYDPDIVTEANVGRQLFSPSDIGLNKANVLITRINRFFGNDWEAVPEKLNLNASHNNITISCVDTIKSRFEIAKVLSRKSGYDHRHFYYWLDFGNTTNSGQVVLGSLEKIDQPKGDDKIYTVSELKKVTDLFDLTQINEKDSGPSCSLVEALQKQDLFINSSLSQLGCSLLWKLISTGSIDYHGLYLNLETMKVNPIKV